MVVWVKKFLLDGLATVVCAEKALFTRGWPGLTKRGKGGKPTPFLEFPVTE
jgi:hypothetical protein